MIAGGAAASDHGPTMTVAFIASAMFAGLLVLSRRGHQARAAWGLMLACYSIITWLFVAEGVEEPAAIVLCCTAVVIGAVLLGARAAALAVLVLTATMISVAALQSSKVLHVPTGHDVPGIFAVLGICGGLAVLALVLSARTVERHESVGELLGGPSTGAPMLPTGPIAALTVRELQIARLIAAGKSNAEIARDLFLSPRTVHTHVSNALRKTGCTNRTELAVLAIESRAGERAGEPLSASAG